MNEILMQYLMVVIGCFGFGLLFDIRKELLFATSLGGFLVWGIFLVVQTMVHSILFMAFVAAACGALYAEIMARVMKTPSTIFFITSILPLVPGGSLYYTMQNFVKKDYDASVFYGRNTLYYAFGIAMGTCFIWATWDLGRKLYRHYRMKRNYN